MEILVVGLHRRHIRRVLLEISVVVEGMRDLPVLDLADLLSADVINEFSCWFNSDLSLNLLDESICIDFACVKSFESIIKSACCTVIKLLNVISGCIYLA